MLGCRRADFSLAPDTHYLNCAYMGPLSKRTQQAGAAAIARKADPTNVTAPDFFTESDRARALFGALIGADPVRVAIIPAVSYGIATVARNISLSALQNVVIAGEQFPSNVYAWRRLCARSGAELRTVSAPRSERRGAAWNEALLQAIDDATAVVALPHVHWTDGTRFDLEAVGKKARAVGAVFVIDGTQSIGALPFDLDACQADAVICATYKWLLGPYGLGFGYFGPRFDAGEPLEENWIARAGSEDFRQLVNYRDEYQPGAVRFDMGERCSFQLMPMAIAALEQLLEWQPARIQLYCASLMAAAIEEAAALGFQVEEASARAAHLFGLRAPARLDLTELNHALQAERVYASLRGSALRIAPNIYNDESDVAALLRALRRSLNAGAASAALPSTPPAAMPSGR